MKNVLMAILIVMMISATTNAVVIPGVGISDFSDPAASVDRCSRVSAACGDTAAIRVAMTA